MHYDYLIAGAGIIGLTLAHALKKRAPDCSILIIEKEEAIAMHASSRNSGVLHAGFYYTADSLKARFTIDGNRAMHAYCEEKGLKINRCGKLVVAQTQDEVATLSELEARGKRNGSPITLISKEEALELEPNVHTIDRALWSPQTSSVDPKEVCNALYHDLKAMGVTFAFNTAYIKQHFPTIVTTKGEFETKYFINCAGLYADKIAHDFGVGKEYHILPFKGLYVKYTKDKSAVKRHLYPVPNLKNPFLGVHFTLTADGAIKIGPTSIPAMWREHYQGWHRFSVKEAFGVVGWQARLFATNAFNFRELAKEELKKQNRDYLVSEAVKMVQHIDETGFTQTLPPGIRAQLLHKKTKKLVQDFVVEKQGNTVHVLNAVSPAFTCSFPFTEMIVEKMIGLSPRQDKSQHHKTQLTGAL